MARIGTGIRPELGRIDYTPYMQGALAGSQSIAQGIATLGQIAGKSINDYYAKKEEEKKKDEAANSFIKTVESNPTAFQAYIKDGKIDKDAVRSMVNTLGYAAALQLNTYLSDAAKQAKAEKTKGDAAKYAEFLTTQGAPSANEPEFMSNLRNFRQNREFAGLSAEARRAGQAMALEQQLGQAQLGKVRAEELALLRPKQQNLSFQEQQAQAEFAAFAQVNGRAPNAQEKARILDKVAKTGAATTNIDLGQKGAERLEIFKTLKEERNQVASVARFSSTAEVLDRLLSNKELITGKTANAELALKAFAQDLGIAEFPEVADTQAYISLIGQAVATQIKNFGAGTALSDADRKFAERMSGADITMTPEALQRLQKILNKASRDTLSEYNSRVEDAFGAEDPFYKTLVFNERSAPFFLSKKTTPPAPTRERIFDGTRFINPKP
jgi:hypothetical protein